MTDRPAFGPHAGHDADRHRIFIAVPLAPAIREASAGARQSLAAYGDRLRWVRPEHLHLTLQFLGNISTEMIAEAVAAAEEVAATQTSFTITLAGLGAFPSAAAARVVWVGVADGADRLTVLADRLAIALQARHFRLQGRPYSPHLTLARMRGAARAPDLRSEAETMRRMTLGEQRVTELVVVESVLGSMAPTHTTVASARLGGGVRDRGASRSGSEGGHVDGTGGTMTNSP